MREGYGGIQPDDTGVQMAEAMTADLEHQSRETLYASLGDTIDLRRIGKTIIREWELSDQGVYVVKGIQGFDIVSPTRPVLNRTAISSYSMALEIAHSMLDTAKMIEAALTHIGQRQAHFGATV